VLERDVFELSNGTLNLSAAPGKLTYRASRKLPATIMKDHVRREASYHHQ